MSITISVKIVQLYFMEKGAGTQEEIRDGRNVDVEDNDTKQTGWKIKAT